MMTLGEYIQKHRHGYPALSMPEAILAGLDYPLTAGWFKRNKSIEVDEVAMREAKVRQRAVAVKRSMAHHAARDQKLASAFSGKVEKMTDAFIASNEFLQSFEWKRVRFLALKKYGSQCQCCGATPASGAILNVDHIKPRRIMPRLALDLKNLQVLCGDCNHGKANLVADFRYI